MQPLGRLRDDAAIIRMIKIPRTTIAKWLSISPEDARALSHKTYNPDAIPRLTRRAMRALVKGRHAHVSGTTASMRAKNLIKFASAYSFEELLAEPGIGTVTAAGIRLWLEERGASLQPSE